MSFGSFSAGRERGQYYGSVVEQRQLIVDNQDLFPAVWMTSNQWDDLRLFSEGNFEQVREIAASGVQPWQRWIRY